MNNARTAALEGLKALRIEKTWPDIFARTKLAQMNLSAQDTALAVNMLYGTIENLSLIDYYIASFSSIKLKKIMPQVLDCLRLAVYQIIFLDKIPDSAAVNESVALARKSGGARAGSFTNAVLRKISGQKESLPSVPKDDFASYLSIQYTHPKWFAEKMIAQLGKDEAEKLLAANGVNPKTTARVNTIKITTHELLQILANQGVTAKKHDFLPDFVVFETAGNLAKLPAFEQGLFYIQDAASAMAVYTLNPSENSDVLDMCSAPGGKAIIASQMQNCKGKLLACDVHEFKAKIIADNAEKYGCTNIKTRVCDSSILQEDLVDSFDYIICDVPCSGMGIVRKKCDIRFKEQESAENLPNLQKKILLCASRYCRKGGFIVYSTCTVLDAENKDVIFEFLRDNKDFEAVPFDVGNVEAPDGLVTLYPHKNDTDGFFISKLRRT